MNPPTVFSSHFVEPIPSSKMFRFYSSDSSKSGEEAGEIENYRARHRQLCRNEQPDARLNTDIGDMDVEDGRTRKIPTKWRQEQQLSNQLDTDGPMNSKAFDFLTKQQHQKESKALCCQDNQSSEEQTSGERHANGSLWERRLLNHQTRKSGRQLPSLGHDALWGSPMHNVTQDARQQTLYFQPQYYA